MILVTRATIQGTTVLRLHGALTAFGAHHSELNLRRALQGTAELLVLDWTAVSELDSAGLGVLLRTHQAARQTGLTLRLAAPGPQPRALLDLVGLSRILPLYADVAAALRGTPLPAPVLRTRPAAMLSTRAL